MKIIIVILSLLVISCSNFKTDSCLTEKSFDITIANTDFNSINQKKLLNNIINNTNITYNKNSKYIIKLYINTTKRKALITKNLEEEITNILFTTKYEIIDKYSNSKIYDNNIIINDSLVISEARFHNIANEDEIVDNFIQNLSLKLESQINIIFKKNRC